MSKKIKIILIICLVAVAGIGLGCYLFLFTYKISFSNAELVSYPDFKITQDVVQKINSGDLMEDSSYFNDIWEIQTQTDGNYGDLFEILVRFNIKRYTKANDYIVEKTIDFSGLSEDDNIFFAKSTGLPDEKVFACQGDGLTAPTYIDLWGYTNGKNIDEIKEIIDKLEITFVIQHANGKIDEKKVGISTVNIDDTEADANDIDSVTHAFQMF